MLANGVSVIGGVAFLVAAVAADEPKLSMLAIYAATGGIEFVRPGCSRGAVAARPPCRRGPECHISVARLV